MSSAQSTPPPPKDRASALAFQLSLAEHNLGIFTGGGADAVIDAEGRIYLLRHAQEHLRRSEHRLRAILDSVADAVAVLNRGAIIQSISRASSRVLGHRPEQLVGENFFQFVEPAEVPDLHFAFTEVIEGIREVAAVQFTLHTCTGSPRIISATLGRLRDSEARAVVVSLRPHL